MIRDLSAHLEKSMPSGVGKTPHRTIRVPDDLWGAVGVKAEQEGRTRTDVVIELLERWVTRPPRKH